MTIHAPSCCEPEAVETEDTDGNGSNELEMIVVKIGAPDVDGNTGSEVIVDSVITVVETNDTDVGCDNDSEVMVVKDDDTDVDDSTE